MIDLKGTKYRLEGILDHVDVSEVQDGYYFHTYLRCYASVQDREDRSDSSSILFSLTKVTKNDTITCEAFHQPEGVVLHVATVGSLEEAVQKLITIHQLSGAGLDREALNDFLHKKQETCHGSGGINDDRAASQS